MLRWFIFSIIFSGVLVLAWFSYDRQLGKVKLADLQGKRILLIVAAKGFNPVEFKVTKELLEQAGAEVVVASTQLEEIVSERWPYWSRKLKIKADILLNNIEVLDYETIVFVGGGEQVYWDDSLVHKMVQEAVDNGMVVAAICKAPVILARAGVLRDKQATAWHLLGLVNQYLREIKDQSGIPLRKNVVVDGKVVTASGPNQASVFTEAIAKLLVAGE